MLRIGDFSRLARVTIKTLHHYDEAGLLRPSHVDRQTGYRYYTAAQLALLQRILLLKDVGFSLEEIRCVLARQMSHSDFSALLDQHRQHLQSTIAEDQFRLKRLDALREASLTEPIAELAAVVLREIPAIDVYSIRERVPTLHGHVTAMFEAAESTVAQHRARADVSPFLVLHDGEYREHDIDVEACIPVKITTRDLPVRRLAGATQAGCVTYRGSYQQTPRLHAAMLQWLERSGFQISGPLREVYHRYGADQIDYSLPAHAVVTSSSQYVTELQTPVVANP